MLRVIASCAVLLGAIALAADTPRASDDPLLQALAGPDWHQRRDAIHELIQLGPAGEARVAELLKRQLDHEQRKNVELALQLIRDNRLFGASPITLHVKEASAPGVVATITAQCGGPLPTDPSDLLKQGKWPKLTLNYDRQPFWEVMKDLASRLEIDYLSSDPQEVRLTRAGGRRGESTSTSGAFLLTASAYSTGRRGINLDLAVYAEPKVFVLRTLDLKLERALDDQGNVLTPQSGRGFRGRGFGRFQTVRVRSGPRLVSAQFQRPPGDRIAELRGQIKLSVEESSARWEVSDLLEMSPITRTIDAIPVTLERIQRQSDENYQLELTIPFGSDGNGTQQEEIIDLLHRGLAIFDAAGRRFSISKDRPDGTRQFGSTEFNVSFSRGPAGATTGPPAKLLWTVPDQTREILVPFEFRNIPIDD